MSKSVTGKIGQLTPSGKLQGILIQRCISKRFELDGKPVYDWVSFALAFRGLDALFPGTAPCDTAGMCSATTAYLPAVRLID
eukprot:scaffold147335_cov13-Tisochrysis_lutea.AAC.1